MHSDKPNTIPNHPCRGQAEGKQGGHFGVDVQPAERHDDRQVERDRDQHLERDQGPQTDHLNDHVRRQEPVDGIRQEAGGTEAREQQAQHAQHDRERSEDLTQQITGDNHAIASIRA